MSFRERPEYQDWRDGVFRLFGRECILCRHSGNIHAHHVRPVNTYPELAFEPKNGVPLCGNCHTEVNSNELAYVDEFERRQRAILGGEPVSVTQNEPNEPELRERANAEPSNTEAVENWFAVTTDAQAVIDFYNQHRKAIAKTVRLCKYLARHLEKLERWEDVIKVTDRAIQVAEQGGTLERHATNLAWLKSEALQELGRTNESATFLRELVVRFPNVAHIHHALSTTLYDIFANHGRDDNVLEESANHILKALELAPSEYSHASWASFVLRLKGDYASALHYGKRALALASTDEDKIDALQSIAQVYEGGDLYADARSYLREAMQIDDCNVDVIADMAHCFYMEDNNREALRMAKHGLMLDPHNESCKSTLDYCRKSSQ